jgi:hypothetical protein
MRRVFLLAASLWTLARGLEAQAVEGQVVERGTNNIVASGTIILFDEPGNEVPAPRSCGATSP